jgi:hypothetical protein
LIDEIPGNFKTVSWSDAEPLNFVDHSRGDHPPAAGNGKSNAGDCAKIIRVATCRRSFNPSMANPGAPDGGSQKIILRR